MSVPPHISLICSTAKHVEPIVSARPSTAAIHVFRDIPCTMEHASSVLNPQVFTEPVLHAARKQKELNSVAQTAQLSQDLSLSSTQEDVWFLQDASK